MTPPTPPKHQVTPNICLTLSVSWLYFLEPDLTPILEVIDPANGKTQLRVWLCWMVAGLQRSSTFPVCLLLFLYGVHLLIMAILQVGAADALSSLISQLATCRHLLAQFFNTVFGTSCDNSYWTLARVLVTLLCFGFGKTKVSWECFLIECPYILR